MPRSKTQGAIRFSDGLRVVPLWQQDFLKPGERIIKMKYSEWVEKVVNPGMVSRTADLNGLKRQFVRANRQFSL